MKLKRFLSVLLSLVMILSAANVSVFAADTTQSVNVNFTAQANGEFLCAPQIGVLVSSDTAENYGFKDSVTGGVSAVDALVKLHEIKYGSEFTKETASAYLAMSDDGYISKLFGVETTANGFVHNGAYPNDGTESDWGGYNGTTVTTQKLSDCDTVEFFMYQDTAGWSDELAWFSYKGNAVTKITAAPKSSIKLNLQTSSYMMAYQYIDADAIHSVGSSVFGAQLAWVDAATGILSDISFAVTDTSGNVSITAPESEGRYYLTAYIPDGTDGEPLIMSLTEIIVSNDAPQINPCALSALSVASFDSNPDALEFTPEFSSDITEYSVSVIDFPSMDLGVFRSIYVKAAAESDDAVISAECNGISADITSGDSTWKMLNGALTGGKNNILKITVAASKDEDAEKRVYSINIPMKPQANTAPEALKETDSSSIIIGDTYSIDLSEIFTDADEVDTLSYKVSIDGEAAVSVEKNYTFTPDKTGVYQLVFTANDGAADSNSYTVNLVCASEETPYFENLQFLSSAIKDYDTTYIFAPTTTEYNLEIKTYSTTKLTLQNTTLFDDEKYTAAAEYTDINGEKKSVAVKNGAVTYLDGIPFDESKVTITLSDKNNADNKTVYKFTVTRPRDTSKTIKSNGIVLVPDGRSLLATKYNGYAEGTMFKVTEDGEFKTSWGTNLDTGVSGTHYSYKCFALGDLDEFSLNITGNTVYEHIRYSIDGENWKELPQGGGVSEKLSFADENAATVTVQIIDDETYANNVKSENDGFFDCEPNEYNVTVERTDVSAENAQILTAITDSGDWYPSAFDGGKYTYCIVVPKDETEKTLNFTVSEGASVKLGTIEQTAVDGVYTLPLTTSQKTLTITSADGKISNTYNFKIQKKADGYPDKVVDFLCINSQYTNGMGAGNAADPWVSLSGSYTSIGNFGGYITYYYEDALTDNPNNKYGIDFYVYGNANKDTSTSTKTSFFEPAQAWVSEDGENWYALAGSAHYDDGVDWNYSVTYSKTASGKTAWIDSHGNSHDGASYSGQYPASSVYCMNDLALSDTITLSGVALPARNGKLAVVGAVTDAYPVKWGYADCFVNGAKGADVNPYADNTSFDLQTNGFDLEWAVDENGNPVDVSDKEFHYVKLVSASNIWHSSNGEKSPEISGVMKTTAQSEAVGKTAAPLGVTITDGADSKTVNFAEGQNVYSVSLDNMKYVSVKVNGVADDDNIYINNQRVASSDAAEGFKVTKEKGETKVRVIVQNGDKEPVIYLLKLTSNATESNELVEGIKIDASGTIREASTKNGTDYTASVGHRISSISITPVADQNVTVTVNGERLESSYDLAYGSNTFEIAATDAAGNKQTVTLTVTRDNAPASTGKTITVKFALYGDEKHGDSETHTYKNDKSKLPVWIFQKSYTVDSGATVLDVFERALTEKGITWKNDGGNYISEINGLAEFDNGALSGWMYSLNGTHSGLGVAEQTIKNGDIIVFHYTDDYTQEQGSEKWTSSSFGGSSVSSYTVKFETNGGNTISSQSISKNAAVTEPVKPTKAGYTFSGWYTDKELTKEYDFSAKVTNGFTLYAKWVEGEKAPENDDKKLTAFADVEKGSWYEEAVAYAVENNLFYGISETEFAPDSSMTRAMLVTVLYRLENPEKTEKTEKTHIFKDVADGEWYTDAIVWAAEAGIVKGVSDKEFYPNANITREQLAALLCRYAQYKKQDIFYGESTHILSFEDFDEISEYAVSSMQWASGIGLIKGETDSTLNPKNSATRAQTAAILMRFCKMKAE